jgi:transposase
LTGVQYLAQPKAPHPRHTTIWVTAAFRGATPKAPPRLTIYLWLASSSWRRAKRWITSPDPGYARKKGGVTTQFLGWCSEQLAAAGRTVLLLVWDNASWHLSHEVRAWLRTHNRQVKQTGIGVRILACFLPTKSPWLNPIEPRWVHAKRAVVEPERLLTAAELTDRVCAHFGCAHAPHLIMPKKVA